VRIQCLDKYNAWHRRRELAVNEVASSSRARCKRGGQHNQSRKGYADGTGINRSLARMRRKLTWKVKTSQDFLSAQPISQGDAAGGRESRNLALVARKFMFNGGPKKR
jgi:hypothetical protein